MDPSLAELAGPTLDRPPVPVRNALALALLSGVLCYLAFPGFNAWPLGVVALVPLLVAVRDQAPSHAFLLGTLCGTVTCLAGFSWLFEALRHYGGFSRFPCWVILILLSAYHGARLGLFSWLLAKAARNAWPRELAACSAFAASELLFPVLFPWYFGAILHGLPILIQTSDLAGPIAVSVLLLTSNLAIEAVCWRIRGARNDVAHPLLVSVGALVLALGYGGVRIARVRAEMRAAPRSQIGIVQGNLSANSFRSGRDTPDSMLRRQLDLSTSAITSGADLVVWSESSFPYLVPERDADSIIGAAFGHRLHRPTILGAVIQREQGARAVRTNSALITDGQGHLVGRYDKHELIAFSERIPLGDTFPKLYDLSPASGHFTPGLSIDPVFYGDRPISVLICYEDILPGFVNRMVRHARPLLLVDISDDEWFGDTFEPALHLALSKFRSVEHHKYLVRSANTGISAIIDPTGRVTAQTRTFTETTLRGEVRWLDGWSLYEVWGETPWLVASAAIGWMAFRRRRVAARSKKITW